MTEFSQAIVGEIPFVPEQPRNVQVVNLPEINESGRVIKMGMHTDTALTLLRTLYALPDKDALLVQGRILTPEQRLRLERSREYRFFLSSRFDRAMGGEMVVIFGRDVDASPEEVSRWLQEPFTPSSLADALGYDVGYCSAADLVERWTMEGRPNDSLPLIGGVNQFSIGSDTLSPERLAEIQARLERAFVDQELGTRLNTATLSSAFSSLNISSLPLYNPSNIINNKSNPQNIIDTSQISQTINKNEDNKYALSNQFKHNKKIIKSKI